jgi:predicted CXXCH cytochrome family protein
LVLWLSLLLLLGLACMQARAADGADVSKETRACLKCHDKPGEVKKLDNGETLSLHISTDKFTHSMHGETDCEDCHTDIDGKTHGKVKTSIASKRQFTLDMRESCRDCHKKNFKTYEDSLHAALVKEGPKEGRKDAPVCSDCHDPHTLTSVKELKPVSEVPCAKCHDAIFKAYSGDVHGLERIAKGKTAPICYDCHKTHEIKSASLGTTVRDSCLKCHDNAIAQHKDWLPNTLRHFEAISCPVCHAPNAKRRVNLRLFDTASGLQTREKVGVPQFEKMTQLADANNLGLNERALWSMLNEFSQADKSGSTVLKGRLEVMSGVEAHQLSDKSHAIKDCNTCHRAGAQAFQSVSLTIAGPDGRPIRHSVQKDVLTSLLATQSIRGFYAIGSTRIKWLDILLVLVMIGACAVPLTHWSIHLLTRKLRARRLAEQAAAKSAASQPSSKGL